MTRPGCTVIKCCFCIPLRNGVLTIGYIELVAKLLLAPLPLAFMLTAKPHECLWYGVRSDYVCDAELSEAEQYMKEHTAYVVSLLALRIIIAFVALLAIIGGHMRKPELLRIYFWITLVLRIAGFIAGFWMFQAEIIYILLIIIKTTISLFFLVVIRSAYLEMEEELRQEKVSNYCPENSAGSCPPPSYTQSSIVYSL